MGYSCRYLDSIHIPYQRPQDVGTEYGLMNLIDAVAEQIRREGRPVITWFDVERVVCFLFRERQFDGKPLKIRRDYPAAETFRAVRKALIAPEGLELSGHLSELVELKSALLEQAAESGGRLLVKDPEFPGLVWRVAGVPDAPPEELCCLVDPWCYVSHLSAMQRWGFTNRNPHALHLTRPSRKLWRQLAQIELKKLSILMPKARSHLDFPRTLRRRELHVFQPSYVGQFLPIVDSHARVSTVPQTFWDTVQEPSRCGGMTHVIEAWEEYASDYSEEIICFFEEHKNQTTNLAFCRAGYIFEEILNVSDDRISTWIRFGKRGGSAKLDPEAPFSTDHSERWNLSINV